MSNKVQASFVCNHSLGADWQHSLTRHKEKRIISSIVACTLAKNFRNPLGVWAIAGLHVLPVWIFGYQYDLFGSHLWFLPKFVEPFGMVILGMGRLLCFFIEMWSIWVHISSLLVNTSAALWSLQVNGQKLSCGCESEPGTLLPLEFWRPRPAWVRLISSANMGEAKAQHLFSRIIIMAFNFGQMVLIYSI